METAKPRIPDELRESHADWSWKLAWSYLPRIASWRLEHRGGSVRYLKVGSIELSPRITEECARVKWAAAHLPVPEVIDCGTSGEVEWLLTRALLGRDATAPELKADPQRLATILGRGLRHFHQAPVESCPFDFTVEAALERVRRRVAGNLVDPDRDFHPEHRHLTPEAALEELTRLRPETEDLVVCHGDYCLPNVLIAGDSAVGFLDLGELGVADRWWDLAVGTWSVTWNLGPGWEEHFLEAYGVERDGKLVAFYRLLYDLAS